MVYLLLTMELDKSIAFKPSFWDGLELHVFGSCAPACGQQLVSTGPL